MKKVGVIIIAVVLVFANHANAQKEAEQKKHKDSASKLEKIYENLDNIETEIATLAQTGTLDLIKSQKYDPIQIAEYFAALMIVAFIERCKWMCWYESNFLENSTHQILNDEGSAYLHGLAIIRVQLMVLPELEKSMGHINEQYVKFDNPKLFNLCKTSRNKINEAIELLKNVYQSK